jgi:pilus assembly protein CpaF
MFWNREKVDNVSSKNNGGSDIALQEKKERFTMANEYFELKTRIHDKLIDLMDLSVIDALEQDDLRHEIRNLVQNILMEEQRNFPLNFNEKERIIGEIQDEVLGLGPLEPFMKDPTVNDILVNTYDKIYVERFGKLQPTEARFKDDVHLRKIIDKIVSAVGRRIDESCPMVDARLADGSRVNAIIPPLAIDGPSVSIRKFAADPLEITDLIELKTLTPEFGELLEGIVRAKLNVLISGGTGSGKTTLLNVLSRFIPEAERIVTIEDSAELQLKQDHVVRLETRPPNIEGTGEVIARDLVRNSLRMRPDRIVVGEVRGGEVLDMLQAMNTGHDGSLTTIHANAPRDALMRMETLMAMTGINITVEAVRRYISSAINVLIHSARLVDGSRKIISIQEMTGMEGDIITMQEIFSFRQTGLDEQGKVMGIFSSTGIKPRFAEKFRSLNIPLSDDLFDPDRYFEI